MKLNNKYLTCFFVVIVRQNIAKINIFIINEILEAPYINKVLLKLYCPILNIRKDNCAKGFVNENKLKFIFSIKNINK